MKVVNPEGHPGLAAQIKEAQDVLVFGHEDRSPHAVQCICKKFYQAALATQLAAPGVFTPLNVPAEEVMERVEAENKSRDFEHHNRLPYLYGTWKAKKKSFRWIAGTCKTEEDKKREKEHGAVVGKPKNALSTVGGLLVKWLQVVLHTLKKKDQLQAGKGIRHFWSSTCANAR